MLNTHIRYEPEADALMLLDQRYLPRREEWYEVRDLATTVYALQEMVIRGAPAIGVTAAYGCYFCARETQRTEGTGEGWEAALRDRLETLKNARPTAVNLRWAVEELTKMWEERPGIGLPALATIWLDRARAMQREDEEINKAMGAHGANLLKDGDRVMTHCNAGALATAGWGTAVGVIYSAVEQGKKITVVANETRPFLQGARLTAYELHKCGVDVTVACDNACALLMKKGLVDKVIVGADRIAANGDAANKIGTYGVALLAKAHGIPFYVAAPSSTFDLRCPTGEEIPIEERTPREVTHPTGESAITPEGVKVYNFAFDVTPAELIAGIITEKGVLTPPYTESIAKIIGGKR
ncbi:Methylthioribose-1-phosphate isomerase [Desulfovibrio sp. X2]|uniref:S-methyl-5-thioribose-1-phosphate isomerase n=1 Tax=Desulfovibrio sp. X2 TaxID=941449 RepID=UPI0003589E31|nr:S-methyl-5-thioribose-1-phosphate isomerase [Desulfovibrio sp. X2]EPR41721.1 Methylthioribose-1-phosphate isomerase [Desulfovibrio sp. X2]